MKKTEIICGKNAVTELLRAGKRKCHEIFLAEGRNEHALADLLHFAEAKKVTIHSIPRRELDKLSSLEKHQGVAAKVEPFVYSDEKEVLRSISGSNTLFLLLDGIIDPQNLGSLLRTAHQLGVDAVFLPKDNSAPIGPAAAKASAGAIEYLPIVQVVNLTRLLNVLKDKAFWVYGDDASEESRSLYTCDFKQGNVALVMGSEGKGMKRLVGKSCDFLVEIPMKGKLDSLNVSVAGAVILAEIMRQRIPSS